MRFAPQELRSFFVTLTCANRRRIFQVAASAALFVQHLQEQRSKRRLFLHAYVVMPDHVHLLITPAQNTSLEKCLQFVKGGFSYKHGSKLDVWQRGYFEKRVPDTTAYDACVRYIDENPIKGGLCDEAAQHPFGSAARHDVDERPAWFRGGKNQG